MTLSIEIYDYLMRLRRSGSSVRADIAMMRYLRLDDTAARAAAVRATIERCRSARFASAAFPPCAVEGARDAVPAQCLHHAVTTTVITASE